MAYKTILVHVDLSHESEQRIRIAASLALAQDAHLVGAAMTGLSRFAVDSLQASSPDTMIATHQALLHQRANQALDQFDAIAQMAGVTSFERRVVDDDAAAGMTVQARYCDLVVISQADPDEPAPATMSDFPEYVILNCGRPVLTIPYAGRFDRVGKRILVAWNASREATRALTAALPLLQQATLVEVAAINPDQDLGAHGEQPGADIAVYLARHGVKVTSLQENSEIDSGNALLSLAADRSSDLLVMGAYGHSRFREVLLGGATRTVLESMTLPVLFAH